MEQHVFSGIWITDAAFAPLIPRNVFHRQLEKVSLPCDQRRNCHILFRKRFQVDDLPKKALLFISADDYYKAYLNGKPIAQGPAPGYPCHYFYNTVDITDALQPGENVLAVHTLYQGLINRVWVSGDDRHGLLCELHGDGKLLFKSDESFRTARHTAYAETGTAGYETQFLESYDSAAPEVGFEQPDFDDSGWAFALPRQHVDYQLVSQPTHALETETVLPACQQLRGNTLFVDFGSCYVGYLQAKAQGLAGSEILIRCGQELNDDGSVRFELRCNCRYEEPWILSGKQDTLDWFDYKAFRYAELVLPEGCQVQTVSMTVRHYPFTLIRKLRPDYAEDPLLRRVFDLCVHTLAFGVQEVIQDCMEREKGFYVGDGCYTALTHLLLTGDDTIVRRLIDDAFRSAFITPTTVTCLGCAFMQEVAEYPLMLIGLLLWHYRLTGDADYLAENYRKACALLDAYREEYETDGLLQNMSKWCVVEWPAVFRDGYDVDLSEGQVCKEPHVALSAYYLDAIQNANKIAEALHLPPYRDLQPLQEAFLNAFYDSERHLFRDSKTTQHASFIGNLLPYAYGFCPEDTCRETIENWIAQRGITSVAILGTFPYLYGLVRNGQQDLLEQGLRDPGAWARMLREDATTTFEGWGRDSKKNASLFHLTLSCAAVFLCDADLKTLFA